MRILFLIFSLLWGLPFFLFAQESGADLSTRRIMCYNVENFFDCEDDSLTNDQDFLPYQGKYWTPKRLEAKRTNIARVIAAVGQGHPPMLVGLVEVENDRVLRELVRYSPLRKWKYAYAHFESPDPRGIDVALLYSPSQFQLLYQEAIPVCFGSRTCSRDILHVCGLILPTADTLHVLVCHTPSRRGGAAKSAYKRCYATSLVREKVQEILARSPEAAILVMGDFNDGPHELSITQCLGAVKWGESNGNLYQLMPSKGGTYKYKGEWDVLDQMFASPSLLVNGRWQVKNRKAKIFSASFLLQDDKRNLGVKPKRTYMGPRYLGGFSDHLPIYLDLEKVQ